MILNSKRTMSIICYLMIFTSHRSDVTQWTWTVHVHHDVQRHCLTLSGVSTESK